MYQINKGAQVIVWNPVENSKPMIQVVEHEMVFYQVQAFEGGKTYCFIDGEFEYVVEAKDVSVWHDGKDHCE